MYEGGGNMVHCYSLWKMKGPNNIFKNNLRKVKMVSEGLDMTNNPKGLESKPLEIVQSVKTIIIKRTRKGQRRLETYKISIL